MRASDSAAQGPIPADAGEPQSVEPDLEDARAYPRGRGGAVLRDVQALMQWGLSPRTRGSLANRQGTAPPPGPIPADAGEPNDRG